MADGGEDRKRKRRRAPIYSHVPHENQEVFIITSTSSEKDDDEDISKEVCTALQLSGCYVRIVTTNWGWISSIRCALWVARRSSAAKLVLVDTHPVALAVLRCLAAPRLAYLQRTSLLHQIPTFKCFYQILLRLADDVIVQNRSSADLYQTLFCNCKAPKILYPCIDIGSMEVDETASIQRIIPNISKYTHLFCTYGNYTPDTNFDLVIDAFEIFHAKIQKRLRKEKVRLIIAGNLNEKNLTESNYYHYILERLEGKKIAKDIVLLTKLSTRCKKTLLAYSVCAIFAYPSARPLLECLFLGRPVVAVKSSIAKELVPRRVGFRLNLTAKDFARALLFLYDDVHLSEKMGHNAKIYYAQHFSFGKFANKVQNFVAGNTIQCQTCLEFYNNNNKLRNSTSDLNSCSYCTRE